MTACARPGSTRRRLRSAWSTVAVTAAASVWSCAPEPARIDTGETVLRIGFGLAAGDDPARGIKALASNLASEALLSPGRDGRLRPALAQGWTISPDGHSLRITLPDNLSFHDGTRGAQAIADVLRKKLPIDMGPAFDDVTGVHAAADNVIELTLNRPSDFLLEGLDGGISLDGARDTIVGTGPFSTSTVESGRIEMVANPDYHGGRPIIDKLIITPYTSMRAAWADMLRDKVDLLYDVGVDAIDSLKSSSAVDVFPFRRSYALLAMLNMNRPQLRDRAIRRALNAAIDREALVRDILRGHGDPALGPVWPGHWAFSDRMPQFRYSPQPLDPKMRIRFTCLVLEPSHERLALAVQRQLRSVGAEVDLIMMPIAEGVERLRAGDFDAILMDAAQGPSLMRAVLYWHSKGPYNDGGYKARGVDESVGALRAATDTKAYAAAAEQFQREIIADPPAIFILWGERARALSRRFEVPVEPGEDILATIHRWKPRPPTQTKGSH